MEGSFKLKIASKFCEARGVSPLFIPCRLKEHSALTFKDLCLMLC